MRFHLRITRVSFSTASQDPGPPAPTVPATMATLNHRTIFLSCFDEPFF